MSAAGRPAAFARLPQSLRAGSRFVAALRLVSLSLLAVPMATQAQDIKTLVSNTGQTASHALGSINAQPFTTGSNALGYGLTSVGVGLSGSGTDVLVRVTPADGTTPDESDPSKIITLTTPSTLTYGHAINTFTAPAGATLAANTTYFVVITNVAIDDGPEMNISVTEADADDANPAAGWTIGDYRRWKDAIAHSWTNTIASFMWIQIKGTIKGTTTTEVPGAPKNLTAEAGDGEVTLSWEAPGDGGGGITGYQHRHSAGSTVTATATWSATTTATEVTVSSLTNGTLYAFEVRAVNSVGAGAAATATARPVSATAVCTIYTSGRREIWTGTVTVAEIVDLSSTIGYGFEGSFGDLSDKTFDRGGNMYTIDEAFVSIDALFGVGTLWFGLENRRLAGADKAALRLHVCGVTFELADATRDVRAYYWDGSALDWSSATSVELALSGPVVAPGAPTGLAATADGATAIDLAWTAPADNGGAAITGYLIELSTDGGSSWSDLVANTGSATTTYEHATLSAGTTRHYRVSAINSAGTGAASNTASATTVSAPGPPTSVSATPLDGAVTVNWQNPSTTGGAAIDCFQIRQKKSTQTNYGDWGRCRSAGGISYSTQVQNLDNGTEYNFQVQARNSAGLFSGPSSTATVTPRGVPGQPQNVTASGGTGSVALGWDPPTSNGGARITHYQYSYKTTGGYGAWTDAGSNSSSRSWVVTGLASGTLHTFKIRAVNAAGGGTDSAEVTATPTGPGVAELDRADEQRGRRDHPLRVPLQDHRQLPRQLDHCHGRRLGAQRDGLQPDQRHAAHLPGARAQQRRHRSGVQ